MNPVVYYFAFYSIVFFIVMFFYNEFIPIQYIDRRVLFKLLRMCIPEVAGKSFKLQECISFQRPCRKTNLSFSLII